MTTPSSTQHAPNKWIVGMDLRPAGAGALRFAAWLHSATSGTSMTGVHVLEEAHLQAALRYHHLDELEAAALQAAESSIVAADAVACLKDRQLVQGVRASDALRTAMAELGAGGIIVGRQAPRKGRHLLRLGRTARRLLRMLPGPIVVVPPDYTDAPAADAPIVVTTNLREDATTAVLFAREFATRVRRPLVALHIVNHIDDYASHYIPEESRAKIATEGLADGKLGLRKWLTGLGVTADREEVVLGHVADAVVEYADEHNPALLVSGSRRLSTVERVLLTSIGSDLAAHASCPVAIVPPMAADLVP